MMTALEIEGTPMPDWPDATCRGDDTSRWFPPTAHVEVVDPLRADCLACPRRDECLTFALENNQDYGIWGGMTDSQRRRIRNGRTNPDREWSKYHERQRQAKRRTELARRVRNTPSLFDGLEQAEKIMALTAKAYGLEVDDLVGRGQARDVTDVRHLAMRRIHRTTGLSYSAIGLLFDRDHTTVMSAVNGTVKP